MFEYAYDLTGSTYPMIREFDIAAATALGKGVTVKIHQGLIVAGDPEEDACVGVTAEPSDIRATKIRVYVSPTAVYRGNPTALGINFASDKIGDTVDGLKIIAHDTRRNEAHVVLAYHHYAPAPVVPVD